MKYLSKKNLAEDNLNKFRDRFYKNKLSLLLKKGTRGLNPINAMKLTEKGEIVVSTQKVIQFLQKQIPIDENLPEANIYFSNIYAIFAQLTKDAEGFSYEPTVSISEKDIQEADAKKTIESLTMNLVITYFNNIKLEPGKVDKNLLTHNLDLIISKSNTGRDYKTLVGNTLKNLIQSLQTDKSWRDCFQHINEASLICRLVGSRLPQIDKSALESIISKSREEVKALLVMLLKILKTKDQTLKDQPTNKKNIKVLVKLDSATRTVLNKIDNCLMHSLSFMKTMNMTSKGLFGDIDQALKQCLIRILNSGQGKQKNPEKPPCELNHTVTRHNLNMLFEYDSIVNYFSLSQKDKACEQIFHDIFQSHLKEIIKEIDNLRANRNDLDMKSIINRLTETKRLLEQIGLNDQALTTEKESILKKYLALIRQIPFDQLDMLLEIRNDISLVTQSNPRDLLEKIQVVLLNNCFSSLNSIPLESSNAKLQGKILKTLYGHAAYYRPMRDFFQRFLYKYVGTKEEPSPYLTELTNANKKVTLSLLKFFSDSKSASEFFERKQIKASEELFDMVKNQIH
ncbi:MAG: hypothetical protein GY707_01520 [Desulfobacteraceae bacterium]|nr:hypothetical protein [Desulfobacteraceae bacterium]